MGMAVMVVLTITVTLVGSEVDEAEVEKATGAAEAVDAKKIARKRIRNNILYAGVGMVGKREANSVTGGNECDGSGLRTGGVCNCEARVPEEEWCVGVGMRLLRWKLRFL
jgi:hypothetical protein